MSERLRLDGSKLYWSNGAYIGDVVKDVDGYYYWWPVSDNYGSWDSGALRLIAYMLDEINAEWDAHVRSYFEQDGETK